ncbi:MAG TPA: xanthine dehydrogenase family protein molybdopterin-binding subunit [Candidatus Tectomicrobia bacterium]|jgi:xanthine dehydrogenase molybdenum-binding subunit|nr:xanthine dehydrogenase family protein molybdopterin-binding subunit [Candidatus Tectomicrobia bacterium]
MSMSQVTPVIAEPASSTKEYAVIGTRPIRPDGTDKVVGRAQYGADIRLTGLLYGKILRSPHAHARIKSIDVSRALAHPGVKAVVTSAELPQPSGKVTDLGEGAMINPRFMSNNCLAKDKVLYKGHAVAAVAATSAHIAEEALALIEVDYEVLPAVLDARDAMREDAPILHERLMSLANPNIRPGGFREEDDNSRPSNIANHFVFEIGDIEQGFREADVVVEREYHTSPVHQGYIEPHSATALWQADGNLTIWCSSQGHFAMREQTARTLGLPVSKVKVIPMEIGGGFGAKTLIYLEPVAALLSKKTGRPVKLAMSRTEVFQGTGPTSGTHTRVKIGAKKDGRITAVDATLIYEAGAFPGSPVNPGSQCMFAPYDIPNARVEGYDVVVNKPKSAAYRAPGAPAAAFASESTIDEVCEKLGMDPLEFRLINGAKEGTRRVTGLRLPRIGYLETLQAAKAHPHYNTPLEGPNRGRGVASGYWHNNTGPASATVSVNPDGTVSLLEGSVDIGGSRAAAAMHVAEVLGLAYEEVKPTIGDTDSIGFTSQTGGSSATFKTGWACYEAAQDVKRQMIERAAKIWEVDAADVEYERSVLTYTKNDELRMTFKELARRLNATGGPIVGRANVAPRGAGPGFAVHIVDVEVDPETGKTQILRYTALQDAGKAIHPSYVEGQIQGGVVQGIGWALNEEYVFNDKGEMLNPSFLDYRMPTSLDLPMIDAVIVEVENPGHPFGLRGVGEVSIVPPMAAIANAIYRATGVRMRQLPMSPSRVTAAMLEQQGS